MKTSPLAQSLGFFDVELRVSDAGGVQWLEAKGNPLTLSDEQKASGSASCPGFQRGASSAERGIQPGGEPTDRRESNRQKSRIRARIEHVFGYMSQSMKGFYLRYIGRRSRPAGAGREQRLA